MAAKRQTRLNPQQLDFLKRYMSPDSPTYGNAYRSAKAAGYSENYATDILQTAPWLQDIAGRSTGKLWTGEEILERLQKEAQGEHAKDRIKSMELLGKAQKLFTEKVEHSGEVGVTIKMVSYADSTDTP